MATYPSRLQRTLQAQGRVANSFLLCAMVARRARQLTQAARVSSVRQAIDQALEEVGKGRLALLHAPPAHDIRKRGKAQEHDEILPSLVARGQVESSPRGI